MVVPSCRWKACTETTGRLDAHRLILGCLVLSSALAVAQAPARQPPPVMIASLPNAPMLSDLDTVRSGQTARRNTQCDSAGKAEHRRPVRRSGKSGLLQDHLIRDRFWVSGQSNFILQAHERRSIRPIPGPIAFVPMGRRLSLVR